MKTTSMWIRWLCCAWLLTLAQAQAKDLRIAFPQYTPPYVLESGEGIVVDLVREALEPAGYRIVPVYAPIAKSLEMLADKRVDGSALIQDDLGLPVYYSHYFMQYHNRAFALRQRRWDLRSLDDLLDKSVLAFQNAHVFLGTAFAQLTTHNPRYQEIPNQEAQVLALLQGRTEVAVMDESIFRYYREKLISERKVAPRTEVDAFPLFSPTPYQTAFLDPRVRDDFNHGLSKLRRSGRYPGIYRKYIDEFFAIKP